MSSAKKLIKEAVREFLLEAGEKDPKKEEDLDEYQYAVIARQLVMKYEDGTVEQNISRLVDNYVKAHKATTGMSLDGEKLYDAVIKEMQNFTDSTNIVDVGSGK